MLVVTYIFIVVTAIVATGYFLRSTSLTLDTSQKSLLQRIGIEWLKATALFMIAVGILSQHV